MVTYENVRSTAEVIELLELDENSVRVRSGVVRVDEEDNQTTGEQGFHGYTIEKETVYTKDEYIILIQQKNRELSATVDSILTDIIPNLTTTA